jgi:predicted O-methyltransferase YrrM
LLFAALEKGAGKAVGVELDPAHAREAREKARNRGLEDKVTFLEADVMDVDLSDATVVLCYLYPAASAALKPKFESELKPGTRIVMESFSIHGWRPAKVKEHGDKTFYLYQMLPEIMDQDGTILTFVRLPAVQSTPIDLLNRMPDLDMGWLYKLQHETNGKAYYPEKT